MSGPASFQRNFKDLTDLMKGQDTLNGWDVLVTYDETQVNDALRARFKDLHFSKDMHVETTYISFETGEEVKLSLDFTLADPTLQILDTFGACQAVFKLSGAYSVATRTINLPSDLQLVVTTSLATVQGTCAKDGTFTPLPGDNSCNPPNWVEILEPGSSVTQGICLNFQNCKASIVDASGNSLPEGLKGLNAQIKSKIEETFTESSGLKWYLAGVNNSYDTSNEDAALLQPTNFCFSVITGAGTTPSSLLMWIAVKGGASNGTIPSGQTLLSFAPNAVSLTPLPCDVSASVIFSRHVMEEIFIKPGLQKASFIQGNTVKCTTQAQQAGISFNFNFASKKIGVPAVKRDSTCDYSLDAVGCDISNETSVMAVSNIRSIAEPSDAPFRFHYISNSQTVSWTHVYQTPLPRGLIQYHNENGQCNTTLRFDGYGRWVDRSTAERPNMLGLNIEFDKQVQFTMDPVVDNSAWSSWWNNFSNQLPPGYKNLEANVPGMSFQLPPLDWFLTTNLLFPGQHVFQADSPVAADEHSSTGLAIPRDTIFTGKFLPHDCKESVVRQVNEFASQMTSMVTSHLSNAPNKAINNGLIGVTRVDAFREEILAFPKTNLLTDLIRALGNSEDCEERLKSVLAQYAYSDLEEFDFFSLLGTSVEKALAHVNDDDDHDDGASTAPHDIQRDSGPMSISTASPTKTLELRMFAGVYIIEQPSQDAGKRLYINPTRSAVTFSGATTVPTQTFDEITKNVSFKWEQSGRSYSMAFDVLVDPDNLDLNVTFGGSIEPTPSSPEPLKFSGRLLRESPSSSTDNPGMKSLMADGISLGFEVSPFDMVCGIFGLAGVVAPCALPLIRRNLPRKIKRLIDRYYAYLHEQNTVMAERVERLSQREEEIAHNENAETIQNFLQNAEQAQTTAIDNALTQLSPLERQELKQNDDRWNEFVGQVTTTIREQIRDFDESLSANAIRGSLDEYVTLHIIDPDTRLDIRNTTIETRQEKTLNALEQNNYFEQVAAQAIYQSQETFHLAQQGEALGQIQDVDNSLVQTRAEIDGAVKAIEQKEEQMKHETDKEKLEELAAAKEKLQDQLKDLIEAEKNQWKDKADAEKREKEAREKAEESKTEHERSRDKAKEARERVRE